jgi:hypothetical protein
LELKSKPALQVTAVVVQTPFGGQSAQAVFPAFGLNLFEGQAAQPDPDGSKPALQVKPVAVHVASGGQSRQLEEPGA